MPSRCPSSLSSRWLLIHGNSKPNETKMNRRLYLIILSIFLLLTSCLHEVDLSEYSIPARMVMNADVVAGQPLSLTLSKTWFIGTKHPNLGLEGAEIQLYVNGTWAEEMVPLSTDSAGTVYCAAYIPKVGDVVRLEATREGYPDVVAEDVVPSAPQITAYQFVWEEATPEDTTSYSPWINAPRGEGVFTFRDPAGEPNYYALALYAQDTLMERPMFCSSLYMSDDILEKEQEGILEGIFSDSFGGSGALTAQIFTDETIDGQTYTLSFSAANSYFLLDENLHLEHGGQYYLRVYSLSETYYRFLKSLQNYSYDNILQDFANQGMSDPFLLFSNVEGGIGLVGGLHYTDIPLGPFYP